MHDILSTVLNQSVQDVLGV